MKNESDNGLPRKLAKPAMRALHDAGYDTLGQLSKISVDELKRLHGIGSNAIEILRRALQDNRLSFASGKRAQK